MSRQTVLDFYKTYYVPGNTTLVIAGNITPEAALALAQADFGKWPARPVPPGQSRARKRRRPNLAFAPCSAATQQGYMTLGFHAPSVQDTPDAWVDGRAADVARPGRQQPAAAGPAAQAQTGFQHQRQLPDAARRRPAHDHGGVRLQPGRRRPRGHPGQDQAPCAIRPWPDDEIRAAKHALLASYLFDAQTNSGRADALGFYNTIDSYKYDTEYITHVLSVTPAQVQQVAQKYLDTDAYTQATLLPRRDPIEASLR